MAKSIDSLLKKKGWSGEEVGKALIASTIYDVKHQSEPDYKPLFSQADFEKMENSLTSERDFTTYGVYRNLYSSIIDSFNRGQGLYQQFYNGYSRYSQVMYLCQQADEALKRAESYPLIVTQQQYDRYRAKAQEHTTGLKESFSSLLFHILEHFTRYSPEEAPEHIRELIEAYKEEPYTNQNFLAIYNEEYGQGYYTLPDGRRSDSMTSEEWQKALKELFLSTHKLTINGEPATAEETYQHYSEQRLLKTYKLFFDGIEGIKALYKEVTGEDMDGVDAEEEARLMEALEDLVGVSYKARAEQERKEKREAPLYPLQELLTGLIDGTTERATEWHYYEEAPEFTKYEVLTEYSEYYYDSADLEEVKAGLKEFKADFPALFSALEAYIKETIPALSQLKPSQYYKELISWGELAELDIIGYKELIEPKEGDIAEEIANDESISYTKHRRYWSRGIAIIQNPPEWRVDENGDYIEDASPIDVFPNLDRVAESERQRAELDAFQNNLFKPALRYLYAFNALMKIIGAVYDIDDTEALQLPTLTFESQLESFNNLIYIFYADVYGDAEQKAHKRELIKELFQPTDIEELKPTKEAIEAVTTELTELGLTTKARKQLKNFDRYIALLMGEGA